MIQQNQHIICGFKSSNNIPFYVGVDQVKALSKLLDSDESSSDDEEKKKSGDEEGEDEDETGKKKKKKKGEEGGEDGNGKEDKADDGEDEKAKKAEKRKALVDNLLDPNVAGPSAKKTRMDPFPQSTGNAVVYLAPRKLNWLREKR